MTEEQTIIILVITLLISVIDFFVTVKSGLTSQKKSKRLEFFVDSVEDTLREYNIEESEFRTIFGNYKEVVNP